MLKYVFRAVHCLFTGRLWSQSQHISAMSETQDGGLNIGNMYGLRIKNYIKYAKL